MFKVKKLSFNKNDISNKNPLDFLINKLIEICDHIDNTQENKLIYEKSDKTLQIELASVLYLSFKKLNVSTRIFNTVKDFILKEYHYSEKLSFDPLIGDIVCNESMVKYYRKTPENPWGKFLNHRSVGKIVFEEFNQLMRSLNIERPFSNSDFVSKRKNYFKEFKNSKGKTQ